MRKQYDFTGARRGAVVVAQPGKTRITIRLDDDLLDWFRDQVDQAGGGNYQSLINDALRRFVANQERPLEQLLRKVVRDELHRQPARRSRSKKAA